MTGSLHRQLSSNTEQGNETPTTDLHPTKRTVCISEADSGNEVEDAELQFEQLTITTNDEVLTPSNSPVSDHGYSEREQEWHEMDNEVQLANTVPDETKKDFCNDTMVAFHGEFARLISVPLSLHYNARYFLVSEDEMGENLQHLPIIWNKLDNAKAQFQCPNSRCKHIWTSMRGRISFSVAHTQLGCIIVLKIFGQTCENCATHTDALWYVDEVCRVMKNLAKCIFECYYPDMLGIVDLTIQTTDQNISRPVRHMNHDRNQRQGRMLAPHKREFCEACQRGMCFSL